MTFWQHQQLCIAVASSYTKLIKSLLRETMAQEQHSARSQTIAMQMRITYHTFCVVASHLDGFMSNVVSKNGPFPPAFHTIVVKNKDGHKNF